jgi:hypothetical protein
MNKQALSEKLRTLYDQYLAAQPPCHVSQDSCDFCGGGFCGPDDRELFAKTNLQNYIEEILPQLLAILENDLTAKPVIWHEEYNVYDHIDRNWAQCPHCLECCGTDFSNRGNNCEWCGGKIEWSEQHESLCL